MSNPLRHLDNALQEINARLAEIDTELASRRALEDEALLLRGQRDQIMYAQKMCAPPQVAQAEVSEVVANG